MKVLEHFYLLQLRSYALTVSPLLRVYWCHLLSALRLRPFKVHVIVSSVSCLMSFSCFWVLWYQILSFAASIVNPHCFVDFMFFLMFVALFENETYLYYPEYNCTNENENGTCWETGKFICARKRVCQRQRLSSSYAAMYSSIFLKFPCTLCC